jgi:hypothetical protein
MARALCDTAKNLSELAEGVAANAFTGELQSEFHSMRSDGLLHSEGTGLCTSPPYEQVCQGSN